MPTLPNGVVTPNVTDSADPVAMLTQVANGFSNAIGGLGTGKRQPKTYTCADQAAKTALATLTTLTAGDTAFITLTGTYETYTGTAWKVTKTTIPIAWDFNAACVTGQYVANGGTFSYMLDGDMVTLRGTYYWDNNLVSWTGSGLQMALPLPCGTITDSSYGTVPVAVGTAFFRQNYSGTSYPTYIGAAYINASAVTGYTGNATLLLSFDTGATSAVLSPMTNNIPVTNWTPYTGSAISIDIRYRSKQS